MGRPSESNNGDDNPNMYTTSRDLTSNDYIEGNIPTIGILAMKHDEERFSSIGMGYHHLSWDKQNWYDRV